MKLFRSLSLSFVALYTVTLAGAQAPTPTPSKTKLDLKGEAPTTEPSVKLEPSSRLSDGKLDTGGVNEIASPDSSNVEIPEALKKLNQEQRDKYRTLRDEVTSYMRSVRLQESLQKLQEAETLVGETIAEIENLRGAVYTKMRDLDSARAHFQKAHLIDKESFHPKFNLAELDFVQKKYAAAISAFTGLIVQNEAIKKAALEKLPEDAREGSAAQFDTTTRLMQFKLLICHAQLKEPDAEAGLQNFAPYDNDSPAYYFAKAALAYAQDTKDKKDEADEWVASAKNIYPPDLTAIFIDSLVEMGWLSTIGN